MKTEQKGFTLIDIMIAVLVIGILAAITIPIQTGYQKKAWRAVAKRVMMEIQGKEESYFLNYKVYAPDLGLMYYPSATINIDDNGKSVAAHQALYNIQVSMLSDSISYRITATPINRQIGDECGVLTIDNTGQKLPVKCW